MHTRISQVQPNIPEPNVPSTSSGDGCMLHSDGPRALGQQVHRRADPEATRRDQVEEEGERQRECVCTFRNNVFNSMLLVITISKINEMRLTTQQSTLYLYCTFIRFFTILLRR